MQYKNYNRHDARILYNTDLTETAAADLFGCCELDKARARQGLRRGAALFFANRHGSLVLKHYHRGGWIGRFLHDTYCRAPGAEPRMWAEFKLLVRLLEMGLPVPEPIAARCQFSSPLSYRGDLVTREIRDATTLSELLRLAPLARPDWALLGRTIARFHAMHVDHADLNAHNILLDTAGRAYLIDFDKGAIRPSLNSKGWKQANLNRLQRSLTKLRNRHSEFHFSPDNWQQLLYGYESRTSTVAAPRAGSYKPTAINGQKT